MKNKKLPTLQKFFMPYENFRMYPVETWRDHFMIYSVDSHGHGSRNHH